MPKAGTAKARDAAKEIERLREEIRKNEYLYYVADDPKISDAEFDRLMERLKKLEAENPKLRTPDSPTQRVGGAPRAGFQEVRHSVPMVSLDNAFSFEALGEFDRRVRELTGREKIDYIAEHKFDGLSLSLLYEKGALVRGVTRGDGTTGEDVTPNVKTIRSIPLTIDPALLKKAGMHGTFEVRGEAIMTRKAFEALNEQQAEQGGKILRTRGMPPPARCACSTRRSRRRESWISSPTTFWWMGGRRRSGFRKCSKRSPRCVSRRARTGNCAIRSRKWSATSAVGNRGARSWRTRSMESS